MEEEQKIDLLFHEIKIQMAPSAVHVWNDQGLKAYMGWKYRKACELAEYILDEYEKEYKDILKIKKASLAVEILGHFILQEWTLLVKKRFHFLSEKSYILRFCEWMLGHMDIIDCGERACDNNRFLWDFISIPLQLFQMKRDKKK